MGANPGVQAPRPLVPARAPTITWGEARACFLQPGGGLRELKLKVLLSSAEGCRGRLLREGHLKGRPGLQQGRGGVGG